ncbi:MAG TPA: MaoC/PaaZ C-terminal domain-containing protein [Bacteroidia bacterium]|nr:MaoC/PaaZ C-terminal domain-containing protein [Bacteroidia bacterium]
MEKLSFKEIQQNKTFDLGIVTLTEEDIINYAKLNDPLDFHIDRKAAELSFFKGFVASGSQIFNSLYKTGWIPMFGHTVICGLELNHWKFMRPVYAAQPISGTATPISIKENEEKKHAVVIWGYEFKDAKGMLVQTLEVTVLHKI